MSLEPNISVVRTLSEFLLANVAGLTDVLEEFPNPNQDLNYPSISVITSGTPDLINWMISEHGKVENVDDPNQLDVLYLAGQYIVTLQVDLWTEYKAQRATFFQRILDAFDKELLDNDKPTGLNLTMTDYHGAIARYDQVGYTYRDNESESQRNEWRAIFSVEVSFPRLVLKTQPKMLEGTIISNVSTGEFDDSNEETNKVF